MIKLQNAGVSLDKEKYCWDGRRKGATLRCESLALATKARCEATGDGLFDWKDFRSFHIRRETLVWWLCSSVVTESNSRGVSSVKMPLPQPLGRVHLRRRWKGKGNSLGGRGTSGVLGIYHLGVTVTVSLGVGTWGSQGGGQRAGMGRDVVFIVVVWLGRPLRVTAGEEVGARPGHSSFLFRAWTTHLLPGNIRNIRSATVCKCACVCVSMTVCIVAVVCPKL